MPDLLERHAAFRRRLADAEERGFIDAHYRLTVDGPLDRAITVTERSGRRRSMLCFDSNSYLGLHLHPRVVGAARRVLDEVGYGTPSAPLLCGTHRWLRELEETLAAFHGREAALTLGKAVAGLNAQSKGRRLGIFEAPEPGAPGKKAGPRRRPAAIQLLGRMVPVIRTREGVRAVVKGRPEDPDAVERYLGQKFGEALDEATAAFGALARSLARAVAALAVVGIVRGFTHASIVRATDAAASARVCTVLRSCSACRRYRRRVALRRVRAVARVLRNEVERACRSAADPIVIMSTGRIGPVQ